MKEEFLFWHWEAEIPKEKCQKIIDEYFVDERIKNGQFYRNDAVNFDHSKRKTDIVWVEEKTELFDLIFLYINLANQQSWNYDLSGMEDVQLGRYGVEGHYQWHIDHIGICSEGFQRKLSCSIQLTDENEYEGGDLILQDCMGDAEIKMTRKQGSIIVFPSITKHKVSPVTSGTRFSAVSWMRGPAFR